MRPQPTTVSHDGGCTDRSGARVPRCTPTGLSHAAGVSRRPEQVATTEPRSQTQSPQLGKSFTLLPSGLYVDYGVRPQLTTASHGGYRGSFIRDLLLGAWLLSRAPMLGYACPASTGDSGTRGTKA